MDSEQLKEVIEKHKKWLNVISEGKMADLRGINLRRAKLENVNLRGADMRGADMSESRLYGADMSGADMGGVNFNSAGMYNINLRNVNLRGADMTDAYLRGADMRGANMIGVSLKNANIRGAKFTIEINDVIEFSGIKYDLNQFQWLILNSRFLDSLPKTKRKNIGLKP